MALCFYWLWLLLAHSVSAEQAERHYVYHINSVRISPLQNNSSSYLERTSAVVFDGQHIVYYTDGKNMASAQLARSWKSKTGVKQSALSEFEGFNFLLGVSSNGAHYFEKRRGCVIERSSGGEVSLVKTTAEYRDNGKIILYFNVDSSQWEAKDQKYLPVKIKWDNLPRLNRNTRNFLLWKCGEKLLRYLEAKDRNEISESEILRFFINEDIAEPWAVQERNWLLLLMFWSICILILFTLYRRRCSRCVFSVSHIAGVLPQFLLRVKKILSQLTAARSPADEDDDDDDDNGDFYQPTGLI